MFYIFASANKQIDIMISTSLSKRQVKLSQDLVQIKNYTVVSQTIDSIVLQKNKSIIKIK